MVNLRKCIKALEWKLPRTNRFNPGWVLRTRISNALGIRMIHLSDTEETIPRSEKPARKVRIIGANAPEKLKTGGQSLVPDSEYFLHGAVHVTGINVHEALNRVAGNLEATHKVEGRVMNPTEIAKQEGKPYITVAKLKLKPLQGDGSKTETNLEILVSGIRNAGRISRIRGPVSGTVTVMATRGVGKGEELVDKMYRANRSADSMTTADAVAGRSARTTVMKRWVNAQAEALNQVLNSAIKNLPSRLGRSPGELILSVHPPAMKANLPTA